MIKETKTEVKKEIIDRHVFCDICNNEISSIYGDRCLLCDKDLCHKCIAHENDCNGDNRPDVWCKKCWDLGEPFRIEIEKLEKQIEELTLKWHLLCDPNLLKCKNCGVESKLTTCKLCYDCYYKQYRVKPW